MQTPEEQRQALRRRILGYVVTVVAIIIIATILFFLMLGYRFNPQNGTVQQGGLVQFISQPTGARITVGAAELTRPTKSKITLNPGSYTVKMQLQDYQPWQKDIAVESGKVLWLNSARLVPYERKTSEIAVLKKADDTLVRQAGKQLAILADKSVAKLMLVPINNDDIVKPSEILFSGEKLAVTKKQQYKLLEWSKNDRYLLLERTNKAQREIVLVDTRNADRSIVVSPIKKAVPIQAAFDPRSSRNVVVRYSDGSVRLVNGETGEVGKSILQEVTYINDFQGDIAQNLVVYAKKSGKNTVATGYYNLDNNQDHLLGEYVTKKQVQISLRKYYADYFIATTIDDKMTVQTSKMLPTTREELVNLKVVIERDLPTTPLAIGFKNENRLIFFAGTNAMTVYDLELRSLSTTNLLGRTKKAATEAPRWLDEQHFFDDATGHLRQYEYDGTNQSDITPVAKGMSAAYTSDGKYLYSFGSKGDGFVLQRTRMILD